MTDPLPTADSTVAEIEAAGGEALGIEFDVTDRDAVELMVAEVVAKWGRVDVLVANAGGGRGRPIDTKASGLDPALLQLVVGMNLFGTIYSCNAVAPVMKQQRSGKIVTVSSVAGTAPSADGGYAHYGAAKAAIAHYTRYLAQDLGPFGITAASWRGLAAEPRRLALRSENQEGPMIKAILTPVILGLAVAMLIRISMARRA
jgi:3-oxoacyl-[acyl-carrier protein] reductase